MTRTLATLLLIGCTGTIGNAGTEPTEQALPDDPASIPFGVSSGEARRLRAAEIDGTLRTVFGDTDAPAARLLGDSTSVFAENYQAQVASGALIEALELLAMEVAERAVETDDKMMSLVGCMPSSAMDPCVGAFIERVGRLILRRPLEADEADEYEALYSQIAGHELGTPRDGVATVLSALLQHPQFAYHIEVGTDAEAPANTRRLSPYEVASRLSFFLWGEAPDDRLLDAAADGTLESAEGRRELALDMLSDERAHQRMLDFHASWLGYDLIPHEAAIAVAMRRESDALVSRVLFEEQRSWLDLFRLSETFIPDSLAALYGLPLSGTDEATWVDVAGTDRGTLLAHGSFLAQGSKFGDTSPVQRGLIVTTRLRCGVVPEPPPSVMVDVDNPPDGNACKIENYEAHSQGGCAGCHASLDGTGMGLETYDGFGSFRLTEPDRPECSLESDGVLAGLGGTNERASFRGPRELSEQLIQSGELDECGVTQLYRFAVGRHEVLSEGAALAEWTEVFRDSGHRFDVLVAEMVASETFVLRRDPEAE